MLYQFKFFDDLSDICIFFVETKRGLKVSVYHMGYELSTEIYLLENLRVFKEKLTHVPSAEVESSVGLKLEVV